MTFAEITCAEPDVVYGAEYSYTEVVIGSEVVYTCNYGFRHDEGSSIVTCDSSGEWSTPDIVCTGSFSSCDFTYSLYLMRLCIQRYGC